ncbi:MAG: UDP-N-acetylmuramoyl-tripeptide--D-alanyl-D-alanine ligase, partial [Actinobacteria bacterium]|nr:UDP-N-acetylmuramoyl-tripeptide--D-alanyl-D-alanine ligase [Actinomycetota bacterium]
MTIKEIAEATGARLDDGDPDSFVTSVTVDSRAVTPGSLFVALPGEHADGHDYVAGAFERGAVAALVSRDTGGLSLVVDEPLRALTALASAVRARLRAVVIAITGSAGKTTTRELTAAALSEELRTVASSKNHNNEIGVPLTICAADETTQALVVEVGARGIGHIASLMPVVRPDVAVVTNVGSAHVGMFGSIDAIAQAKGEIVEALGTDGVAVLNADDLRVGAMRARAHGSVLMYGFAPDADVRAEDVSFGEDARASFTVASRAERAPITLCIPGEHMISNALAAAGAALACGVSLDGAARGIARCDGVPQRMQ